LHTTRPQQKRIGRVGIAEIPVAAALDDKSHRVAPREIDRDRHIGGAFGGDGVVARARRPCAGPPQGLGECRFVSEVVRILAFGEERVGARTAGFGARVERGMDPQQSTAQLTFERVPINRTRVSRRGDGDGAATKRQEAPAAFQ
jgi:hypothetical protein